MKIQTIETQVTHTHVLFLSLLPLRGKTTGEQTAFDWMQLPPDSRQHLSSPHTPSWKTAASRSKVDTPVTAQTQEPSARTRAVSSSASQRCFEQRHAGPREGPPRGWWWEATSSWERPEEPFYK